MASVRASSGFIVMLLFSSVTLSFAFPGFPGYPFNWGGFGGGLENGGVGNVGDVENPSGGNVGGVGNMGGGNVGGVGNMGGGNVGGLGNVAGGNVGGVGNAAGGNVGGVGNAAGGNVGGVGNTGNGNAGGVGNTVGGNVGGVGNAAGGNVGGVGNTGNGNVGGVGNTGNGNVGGVGNAASGNVGGGNGNGGSANVGGGNGGNGNGNGGGNGGYTRLFPQFYQFSCPQANDIVTSVLQKAITRDPRIAASLLRLHFHDCFVQGCDASVLLDDSSTITSEKNSIPNKNSIRGFEVIDEIKTQLEAACPQTVSCADIVALAARSSTVLSGGPYWDLPLGRKDSKTASINDSNNNIPPPNSTIQNLVTLFNRQGLDEVDLVALSGSHTIGVARCVSFRQRLYNQNGNNQPDENLERDYYSNLKSVCPKSGGDNIISPLDFTSPTKFNNAYFKLILYKRGLLNSDEVLLTGNGGSTKTAELVKSYAEDEGLFFSHFATSMVKMGNINPLIGNSGEVRKNCRLVN